MLLYRCGKEATFKKLDGRGASYNDGARWNHPKHPVVYLSPSPSVALLEMGNYIASPRFVPSSYALGIFEIEDARVSVESVDVADLDPDWNDFPSPESTKDRGTHWLKDLSSLFLSVPSAAVPGGLENCWVMNPLHPDAGELGYVKCVRPLYN